MGIKEEQMERLRELCVALVKAFDTLKQTFMDFYLGIKPLIEKYITQQGKATERKITFAPPVQPVKINFTMKNQVMNNKPMFQVRKIIY